MSSYSDSYTSSVSDIEPSLEDSSDIVHHPDTFVSVIRRVTHDDEFYQNELDNLILQSRRELDTGPSQDLLDSSEKEIDVEALEEEMRKVIFEENTDSQSSLLRPVKSTRSVSPLRKQKLKMNPPEKPIIEVNGVELFLEKYMTECKNSKVTPISDFVNVLKYYARKRLSLEELDLSNMELTYKDVVVLSNTFRVMLHAIQKQGKDILLINSIEPRRVNLSSNLIKEGKCIVGLLCEIGCVESLNMGNSALLGTRGATDFSEAMVNYKNLSSLSLYGNFIGVKACNELLNTLSEFGEIEQLDLGKNNLTESCAPFIANLIMKCPIVGLSLRMNPIGSNGMSKIVEAMQTNEYLTDIDFTDTHMGSAGIKLLKLLQDNPSVKRLCIGLNEYAYSFPEHLKNAVASFRYIEVLDIRSVNVPCLRHLMSALMTSSTKSLRELILSGNVVNHVEAESITAFLGCCKRLETLGIRNCHLKTGSLIMLCNAIKENRILRALDISYNSMKNKRSFAALCDMIRFNQRLSLLSIAGMHIDRKTMASFGFALQTNKSLIKVYIDENKIGDKALLEFGESLLGNKTIKIVSLKTTRISEKGVKDFLKAVDSTGIEAIDIRDNEWIAVNAIHTNSRIGIRM